MPIVRMNADPAATFDLTERAIREAHGRIAPFVRRTPLFRARQRAAASDPDPEVTFKLELLQHAGSFKTRGAFHQLLSRAVPPSGVTAASGGNHGVAVALAAARLGHRARIFVPEIASPVKIAAIRAHGAEVVIGGARYADAQSACDDFAKSSHALLVHPFDAPETLAGAGTVALEWEEDQARTGLAPLETVLVAVGGGGLVAGMAAWYRGRVKVVGVEPAGSRCLHAALEAGAPVDVPVDSIAADSLGARRAGDLPFRIARAFVDHVVLDEDDDIRAAQRRLWSECRLASEPGGAAAYAALLSNRYAPRAGERVGVLLCGSNVDPTTLV
jgi:threonine dehydratase